METTANMEIAIARESDLDGVLELQATNQIANGGMLSASFSRSQLQMVMKDMPLLVARRAQSVVGFLICSTTELVSDIPIILAMLDSYLTAPSRGRGAESGARSERGLGRRSPY